MKEQDKSKARGSSPTASEGVKSVFVNSAAMEGVE